MGPAPAETGAPKPTAGTVLEGLEVDDRSQVTAGHGLLEVVTGHAQASVRIEGKEVGRGEAVEVSLPAGTHAIVVVLGEQIVRSEIRVSETERTRWTVEAAWEP